MGVHGSTGAGGAGPPSLPVAVRLAAASCCPPPAPAASRPGAQQPQRRPEVRGGGPAHGDPQRVGGLDPALHQHCQHGSTVVLPSLPTAVPRGAVPAPGAALVALAVLLGEAAPAQQPQSLLRQIVGQLANILAGGVERLRLVLPASHGQPAPLPGAADTGTPAAPRMDAPAAPLQPMPPPPLGPMLTLDPALGTIVDVGPLPGSEDVDGQGGQREPADAGEDAQPLVPSAWVPVAMGRLRRDARAGLDTLVDRIGALLAEVGMTRLQLLLLVVVAPLAVAFGIDVVASILSGR